MNVLVLFLLEDELSDAFESNENEKRGSIRSYVGENRLDEFNDSYY